MDFRRSAHLRNQVQRRTHGHTFVHTGGEDAPSKAFAVAFQGEREGRFSLSFEILTFDVKAVSAFVLVFEYD